MATAPANPTEAILTQIKGFTSRLDGVEKSIGDLAKPQSKTGLSMADLQRLTAGGDGAALLPNGQILHLGRKAKNGGITGLGMGPALVEMYRIMKGGGSPEQLEKQFGLQTLERYRTEGMKQPDGSVRKAALAEGSGVTGGYVVPPQWSNELLRLAIEEAIVRQLATVIPMTSRTLTIPSLDVTTVQGSGKTPFLGGIVAAWQPEAASINESEPTFRQTELTAWDLVFYTVASNMLLADNGVALDALLTQLFKEAIAWYGDYAFLQGLGSGSSMPLGVLNSPATLAVNRAAASHFRLADAAAMLSKLLIASWKNAVWVMHPSVLPELLQMTDNSAGSGAGRLVWVNPAPPSQEGGIAGNFPMTLLGLPIYFTEKVPVLGTKGDVLLCDFSRYVIGDRMDLQIDVSPHVKFVTNQMVWRVVARMDGKPWLNGPVTLADGTYTVSPFIALN